ncbi:MAG TPA: hypothetical protein VKR38_13470, partial [Usitatibacter sp.]|nr:hypothetical protein [Usitatibacter sp.]
MSLLKHIDRLAVLSILSVCLGIPAAAYAFSAGDEPSSQVVTRAAPTDANFRSIKAGMTSADVLARLGP